MYRPLNDDEGLFDSGPAVQPLVPMGEFSWIWRVGDDFDMSARGTYRVSFGGPLNYLDAVVCSNSAEVRVER